MKPLSQTQEKLPPGWLTQCPWGPHTPEGLEPGTWDPASKPQPSITVAEGQQSGQGAQAGPALTPLGLRAAPCTSAASTRAGRPGHRAVLAAKVLGAGAVVVALQVVAAGTIQAGAWLAEVHVHLWPRWGV